MQEEKSSRFGSWRTIIIVIQSIVIFFLSVSALNNAVKAESWEDLYYGMYRRNIVLQNNMTLRYFDTYEEMQGWVNQWVYKEYFSVTGVRRSIDDVLNLVKTGSPLWSCSDFAEKMVKDGRKDGYYLSECLVDYEGKVYGIEVSSSKNHAGVLAVCDGSYWFIEPQTAQIVFIVDRKPTQVR